MALAAGSRIGPYEITASLGAGGMGEVYRATDSRLGREVAIKTLPPALANDADRLARFEREAKLLAALNHPNIAAIYGLDAEDGTQFIAMELVDGQTLEQKLESGPLPPEDALRIALQIAEALEAAHDKGVVHRDLKPANVMLTRDGIVKVLDFGLAKAFSTEPDAAVAANSPALSLAMTQQGLILGTAGYMSPEQAAGQATDQRADIWSFGVVLYEMLTGMPLFRGESVPHILADVLKTEPDWARLPANLHPRLKLMLARCLTKRPRDRYHSIADARVDIESVLRDPVGGMPEPAAAGAVGASPRSSSGRPIAFAVLATAAVIGVAAALIWRLIPESPRPITRFSIEVTGSIPTFQPLALSPDGQRIVYTDGERLWSRRMDQIDANPIPGTEGGDNPFFSPDGESIAFFSNFELKAVGFGGETPRVLATVADRPGIVGTWDDQGRIFFGQAGPSDLSWVPARGGTPAVFAERGDYIDVDFADVLPGGERVLFSGSRTEGNWSESDIVVQNVATGERQVVVKNGYYGRYVDTGHLLYARAGALYAQAFDLASLEVRGPVVPIVQRIAADDTSGYAKFAVASNGTLIFMPGTGAGSGVSYDLVAVGFAGDTEALSMEFRDFRETRFSPDGTKIAVTVNEGSLGNQIWVLDIASGNLSKLTLDGTSNTFPVWSPDGRDIYFASNRGTNFGIYRQRADGSGDAVRVVPSEAPDIVATDVLPGNRVVYQLSTRDGARDIRIASVDTQDFETPIVATTADEFGARVSPDGNWLAYVSDESGEPRIYVLPFGATGGRRAVSDGRGLAPTWSADGSEIYYIGGLPTSLMAVTARADDGAITIGRPRELFNFVETFRILTLSSGTTPYAVNPDGSGFAAVRSLGNIGSEGGTTRIDVVLNWTAELSALVPTD